jgi:hypothetical protein
VLILILHITGFLLPYLFGDVISCLLNLWKAAIGPWIIDQTGFFNICLLHLCVL